MIDDGCNSNDDQDLLRSIGTGCEDDVSCSKKRLLMADPLRLGRRKWLARRRRPCHISMAPPASLSQIAATDLALADATVDRDDATELSRFVQQRARVLPR
jgi:hypothetical protein